MFSQFPNFKFPNLKNEGKKILPSYPYYFMRSFLQASCRVAIITFVPFFRRLTISCSDQMDQIK